MLGTHCTAAGCKEQGVVKEVPEDLADAAIICGACNQPTTTPAQTTAQPGAKVA